MRVVCVYINIFIFLYSSLSAAKPKVFEVFDGQFYNNRYYPRVDVIEWTDDDERQSHAEFHVYWKGHQLDFDFALETVGNKKVLLVKYIIPERNEALCRRVIAPAHFHENFYLYKDQSDRDMDRTIVRMTPSNNKKYKALTKRPFKACVEEGEEGHNSVTNTNTNVPSDDLPPGISRNSGSTGKNVTGPTSTDSPLRSTPTRRPNSQRPVLDESSHFHGW